MALFPTDLFNGTYVQNFDAKGRVSIPAPFRAALRSKRHLHVSIVASGEGPTSIPLQLRPSEKVQCIEALTEGEASFVARGYRTGKA